MKYWILLFSLTQVFLSTAQDQDRFFTPREDVNYDYCQPFPLDDFLNNKISIEDIFKTYYNIPKHYKLYRYEMWFQRFRTDPVHLYCSPYLSGKCLIAAKYHKEFLHNKNSKLWFGSPTWLDTSQVKPQEIRKKVFLEVDKYGVKPVREKWIDLADFPAFKKLGFAQNHYVHSMNIYFEDWNNICVLAEFDTGTIFNRWILPCDVKNVLFELNVMLEDGTKVADKYYLELESLP